MIGQRTGIVWFVAFAIVGCSAVGDNEAVGERESELGAPCQPGRGFANPIDVDVDPGGGGAGVIAVDLNGDGRDDLVAHDFHASREYSFGGKDTWPVELYVSVSQRVAKPDSEVRMAPQDPITLGEQRWCLNCADEADVAVADFDGDHKPDIAVSMSANNAVFVLINQTRPPKDKDDVPPVVFSEPIVLVATENPVWIRAGDFDGDGKIDLATVNFERRVWRDDHGSLTMFKGDGTGGFGPRKMLGVGLGYTELDDHESPLTARLNQLEVVHLPATVSHPEQDMLALKVPVLYAGLTARIRMFLMGSDAKPVESSSFDLTYDGPIAKAKSYRWNGFGMGDLDGNGIPDMVGLAYPTIAFDVDIDRIPSTPSAAGLAAKNTEVQAYFALNASKYWRRDPSDIGVMERAVIADMDGDGNNDVVAFMTAGIEVGFGDGSRTLQPFANPGFGSGQIGILTGSERRGTVLTLPAIGDFNGDGYKDIVAHSFTRDRLWAIHLNLGLRATDVRIPMVERIDPTSELEDHEVKLIPPGGGGNYLTPIPIREQYVLVAGDAAPRSYFLSGDQIVSDDEAHLRVPFLGDDSFWAAHRGGKLRGRVDTRVWVKNTCATSSPVPLTIVEHPSKLPPILINNVAPRGIRSGQRLTISGSGLGTVQLMRMWDRAQGANRIEIDSTRFASQSADQIQVDLPKDLDKTFSSGTSLIVALVGPSTTDPGSSPQDGESPKDILLKYQRKADDPFPTPVPTIVIPGALDGGGRGMYGDPLCAFLWHGSTRSDISRDSLSSWRGGTPAYPYNPACQANNWTNSVDVTALINHASVLSGRPRSQLWIRPTNPRYGIQVRRPVDYSYLGGRYVGYWEHSVQGIWSTDTWGHLFSGTAVYPPSPDRDDPLSWNGCFPLALGHCIVSVTIGDGFGYGSPPSTDYEWIVAETVGDWIGSFGVVTSYQAAHESKFSGAQSTLWEWDGTQCQPLKPDVPDAFYQAVCAGRMAPGFLENGGARIKVRASETAGERDCRGLGGGHPVCSSTGKRAVFDRFVEDLEPFGFGTAKRALRPFRSVAASTAAGLKVGDVIYIHEFSGVTILEGEAQPDGSKRPAFVHDGCFRVDDLPNAATDVAGSKALAIFSDSGSAAAAAISAAKSRTTTGLSVSMGGDMCAHVR